MNAKGQTWDENILTVTSSKEKSSSYCNNLVKWDHGWWHKYTKQAAFSDVNRNRRLDLTRGARVLESPLGCQKHTGKNDTALIDTCLKHIPNHNCSTS